MSDKNKGSVLVLTLIIITVVSSISLTTLSIAVSQYQIKKNNSSVKRALYLCEDGINNATLRVYTLVSCACADSAGKADEYIELYPEDIAGAEALFKSNYKSYVINRAVSTINISGNPSTKVANTDELFFIGEKLTLRIRSKYMSADDIEKSVTAELDIWVPCYRDIKTGVTDVSELFVLSSLEF